MRLTGKHRNIRSYDTTGKKFLTRMSYSCRNSAKLSRNGAKQ